MSQATKDSAIVLGACVLVGSVGGTGTVVGIDDRPPTKGVSVRLHRPVNGVDVCYATHSECTLVERSPT